MPVILRVTALVAAVVVSLGSVSPAQAVDTGPRLVVGERLAVVDGDVTASVWVADPSQRRGSLDLSTTAADRAEAPDGALSVVAQIAVTDRLGETVTDLPHGVQMATTDPLGLVLAEPGLEVRFAVDGLELDGATPGALQVLQRAAGADEWVPVASAWVPSADAVVAQAESTGEFVVVQRAHAGDEVPVVALDLDDNAAWAMWDGELVGEQDTSYDVATLVQTYVESVCTADVVITRPEGAEVVDPALRAAAIDALDPALAITLGFDATDGFTSGGPTTGGARIWSADDDAALAAALGNELQTHTGRPAEALAAADLGAGLYQDLSSADYPYARVELAYLDHSFDRPIIERRPDLYALAVAKAVVNQLEAQPAGCGTGGLEGSGAQAAPVAGPAADDATSATRPTGLSGGPGFSVGAPVGLMLPAAAGDEGTWVPSNTRHATISAVDLDMTYSVTKFPAQGVAGEVVVYADWTIDPPSPMPTWWTDLYSRTHFAVGYFTAAGPVDYQLKPTSNTQPREFWLGDLRYLYGYAFSYVGFPVPADWSGTLQLDGGLEWSAPWGPPPGGGGGGGPVLPGAPSQDLLDILASYGLREYFLYGGDPVNLSTGSMAHTEDLFQLTGVGDQVIDLTLSYNGSDGRITQVGQGWNFAYTSHAQQYANDSILITLGDGQGLFFTPDGNGGFTAPPGAKSTLATTSGGVVLTFADGTQNTFTIDPATGVGTLTGITDRQGNDYTLTYGEGSRSGEGDVVFPPLQSITDQAGQTVAVQSTPQGRITGFTHPDGRQWTLGYDGNQLTSITDGAGRTRRFGYNGDGLLTTITGADGVVEVTNTFDDAQRVATQTDGMGYTRTFAYTDEGVTTLTDALGNATVVEHNDDGLVERTNDPEGGVTQTVYDAQNSPITSIDAGGAAYASTFDALGRVLTYTDPLGRATTYTYNATGDLTSTSSPAPDGSTATTTLVLNADGRAVETHLPDGTVTRATYDDHGDVATLTDAMGNVTRFGYDSRGNTTRVTDALGNLTVSVYDLANRLMSTTDARGATTSFSYDAADNLLTQTDALGGVTTHAYDAADLRTSTTDPLGRVTRYEHNPNLQVTAEIRPDGSRVEYAYDAEHRLTAQTNPDGTTKAYEYDILGRQTVMVDEAGQRWLTEYDAVGNPIARVDAAGNRTEMTYDDLRQVEVTTDALGHTTRNVFLPTGVLGTSTDQLGQTTSYAYDVMGNLERITTPDGAQVTYVQDDNGNVVQATDQRGFVTAYTYDALNRETLRIDAAGGRWTTEYDEVGNAVANVDASGARTVTHYDLLARPDAVTDALGGVLGTAYDAAGRLTAQTDQLGRMTSFGYDALGLLTSVTAPDGTQTVNDYDVMGRLISETDALGLVRTLRYDELGRQVEMVDQAGQWWLTEYDEVGNPVAQVDPAGNRTELEYDARSQQVAVVDALGNRTQTQRDARGVVVGETDEIGNTTTIATDEMGRTTGVTTADGESASYLLDEAGNVVRATDQRGFETRYTYDPLNRQVLAVDARGGRTVTEYDLVGNVVATVDANGSRTATVFDLLARPEKVVDALGREAVAAYDAAGQLLSQTDPLGRTTSFAYDLAGRVTVVTAPDGTQTTSGYDVLGRVVSQTDARGLVTALEYDPLGRQVAMVDAGGGRWATEYDASGNVLSTVDANGARTAYEYDAVSQQTAVVDALGHRTQTVWDARGVVTEQVDALGGATTVVSDEMGRPLTVTTPDGGVTRYAYDAAGDPTSVTNPRGFATATEYDELGRPVAVVDALEGRTVTEYDGVGNVTATVDATGARTAAVYDALSRPVSVTDALGGVSGTTYDAAGQVVATTDALDRVTGYTYDPMGQVVVLTRADGTVVGSEYNPTGELVGQVNARGFRVGLEVDGLGRQVGLVDEAGQRWLTEYDAVGNVVATVDPSGARSATEFDAMSRPVATVDAVGARTAVAYDAVGNPLAQTDALGNATGLAYDVMSRLVSQTSPQGAVTQHAYDLAGNRTSSTDARGLVMTGEFDALDRPVAQVAPDGGRAVTAYDAVGRPVSVTDALGYAQTVVYDGLGRPVTRTDGGGFATTLAYDAVGNVVSRTSPRGGVARAVYDSMDRAVSQTNAEGEATSSGYDGQGNVVSRTDPVGVVTEFAYDGRDLLVTTVENVVAGAPGLAEANVVTLTGYDLRGVATSVTDPRGNTTAYELDGLGRAVASTDPLGRVSRTGFDPLGRVATQTAGDGSVTATSYTADGFTAQVAYPDQVVSYGYDVVGNRTSMTDRLGASSWVVDWAGRATSATDAKGKTVSYGFDLVGNQTRVAYPDGRVVDRTFDGRGLGVSQSDRDGSTTFAYDGDGGLVSVGRASGVSTTISRDLVGRATQVVHAGRGVVPSSLPSGVVNPASMAPGNAYGHCNAAPSGHPNQQPAGCDTGVLAFAYVYDDRGLVTHRDVSTDLVTTATDYTHDPLGRLTSSTTGEYVATYAWDASSNPVAETVSDDLGTNLAGDGHAIARVVDAANQTTSIITDFGQWPDVQTTTVALSYDGRGNRTGETTTRTTGGVSHVLNAVAYTFDGMDQLVGSHDTGENQNNARDDLVTTWARDGMGRALSVTEVGVTRGRVFDGADVVVDGPTRVTRGPDGRALFEAFETVEGHGRNAATVTVTRDVLTDVLGSAVSIATGGLITADLALFGDFGDLVTTPDWATSTGFTGRTTAAGLVEFATRDYDPDTRVWVQDDTYPGTTTRSASLNGYAYVQGAPETYTDALGFARAQAAIRALRLSAAETAYLMAVAAQFRATPRCTGYYGCYTDQLYAGTVQRTFDANAEVYAAGMASQAVTGRYSTSIMLDSGVFKLPPGVTVGDVEDQCDAPGSGSYDYGCIVQAVARLTTDALSSPQASGAACGGLSGLESMICYADYAGRVTTGEVRTYNEHLATEYRWRMDRWEATMADPFLGTVTIAMTALASAGGGECSWNERQYNIVCGNAPSWMHGGGGTQYGAVFVTSRETERVMRDSVALGHEATHQEQWLIFGEVFVPYYFADMGIAKVTTGELGCGVFERWAGYEDGGYDECVP